MMVRYASAVTHPTVYKNLNDRSTEYQEAAKATNPGVLPEAAAPDFSYI
jgi:hypothetical protein